MLLQGVPPTRILSESHRAMTDIALRGSSLTPNRDHLLTMSDVYNEQRALSRAALGSRDDASAVSERVAELSATDHNPILLYKPQGSGTCRLHEELRSSSSAICDGLDAPRFMLALQTVAQRQLWELYGSTNAILDTTHGTNQYGFKLTSLMVIDDDAQGQVVAWLVSDREDATAMTSFLQCIRSISAVRPSHVITDDSHSAAPSIRHVFPDAQHLVCHWHIDRAWRKAVYARCPKGPEGMLIAVKVYQTVRALLELDSERDFDKSVDIAMAAITQVAPTFAEYFRSTYLGSRDRIRQWASFARDHTRTNTSNAAESFHNTFKTFFLHRMGKRRVDDLLEQLFAFERHQYHKGQVRHLLQHRQRFDRAIDALKRRGEQIPSEHIRDEDDTHLQVCACTSQTHSIQLTRSHDTQ